MEWKAVDDRLIVRPHQKPEVTAGGVILPEMAREKPITGDVLGVGPRVEDIEEGDVVAFSRYGGIEFDGGASLEDLLVLRQTDVLCVRPG